LAWKGNVTPLGVPIGGRSRPAVAGITHPEAEQRAPGLKQQAQQSAETPAFDDGNGAAAYADTGTREFPAERPTRPRRDR
jgi:hypothetical protein